MLLFEALNQFESRLEHCKELERDIPDYFKAMKIASESIKAQMRLMELLDSFTEQELKNDSYSAELVYDFLSGIRYDAKFDEDGMFIRDDEDEDETE